MITVSQFLPETLTGWLGVITSLIVLFAAIVGLMMWLLDQRISVKSDEAVKQAFAPIQLQLTTMNGEIARIRTLEAKLENGLGARLDRLEERLDEIIDHLLDEKEK